MSWCGVYFSIVTSPWWGSWSSSSTWLASLTTKRGRGSEGFKTTGVPHIAATIISDQICSHICQLWHHCLYISPRLYGWCHEVSITMDWTQYLPQIHKARIFYCYDPQRQPHHDPDPISGAIYIIVHQKNRKQMKSRNLTMGYHHVKLNPLPSTWKYPNVFTVIHLMNLWLIGNRKDKVPPLEIAGADLVSHIDNGSRNFSKMRQVMSNVEEIGREDKFWVPYS